MSALLAPMAVAITAFVLIVALPGAARAQAADPPLQLDVTLDPATRRLDVVAEVRPQIAPPARNFDFALHPSLRIESASSAGKSIPVTATTRRDGLQGWRVPLAGSAPVRLAYGGV